MTDLKTVLIIGNAIDPPRVIADLDVLRPELRGVFMTADGWAEVQRGSPVDVVRVNSPELDLEEGALCPDLLLAYPSQDSSLAPWGVIALALRRQLLVALWLPWCDIAKTQDSRCQYHTVASALSPFGITDPVVADRGARRVFPFCDRDTYNQHLGQVDRALRRLLRAGGDQ